MSIDYNEISCPAPMTRTELVSLRASEELSKDCHYVVNDYERGSIGAVEIMLHATDANTFSKRVDIKTAFDNVAWTGLYDIDTNRLSEVQDNRGNVIRGEAIVDSFPWGNASVSNNLMLEPSSFDYVKGAFTNNEVGSGASVTVDSPVGVMSNNVIHSNADVTWQSGDFRNNTIASSARVNSETTGDFDNNTIAEASRVNVRGSANVDTTRVLQSSTLEVTGGNVSDNLISGESDVTVVGGSFYENVIKASSIVTLTEAVNFYRNDISADCNLIFGALNVYSNKFAFTRMNTTGSIGNIRYCDFANSFGNTVMQNVANLDFAYVTVKNNSSMAVNNAARVYLRFITLNNFGRILASAGASIDANYTSFTDYGYAQALKGSLFCNYSTFSGVSYVRQDTDGVNRVERTSVTTNSRIRFLGECTGTRVYYCNIGGSSFIEGRGTSTDCYFYNNDVHSASQMYCNNSIELRAYHNTLAGNSQFYSQNVTGRHFVYYNGMTAHGYIRFFDSTGGRIYAVHCHGQGLLNFVGANENGRLYYSSFTAYYYLTARDWTITRHSLHGSGRQSYTVTNPPANGTATRNF